MIKITSNRLSYFHQNYDDCEIGTKIQTNTIRVEQVYFNYQNNLKINVFGFILFS